MEPETMPAFQGNFWNFPLWKGFKITNSRSLHNIELKTIASGTPGQTKVSYSESLTPVLPKKRFKKLMNDGMIDRQDWAGVFSTTGKSKNVVGVYWDDQKKACLAWIP
jgi:hypothetical protein